MAQSGTTTTELKASKTLATKVKELPLITDDSALWLAAALHPPTISDNPGYPDAHNSISVRTNTDFETTLMAPAHIDNNEDFSWDCLVVHDPNDPTAPLFVAKKPSNEDWQLDGSTYIADHESWSKGGQTSGYAYGFKNIRGNQEFYHVKDHRAPQLNDKDIDSFRVIGASSTTQMTAPKMFERGLIVGGRGRIEHGRVDHVYSQFTGDSDPGGNSFQHASSVEIHRNNGLFPSTKSLIRGTSRMKKHAATEGSFQVCALGDSHNPYISTRPDHTHHYTADDDGHPEAMNWLEPNTYAVANPMMSDTGIKQFSNVIPRISVMDKGGDGSWGENIEVDEDSTASHQIAHRHAPLYWGDLHADSYETMFGFDPAEGNPASSMPTYAQYSYSVEKLNSYNDPPPKSVVAAMAGRLQIVESNDNLSIVGYGDSTEYYLARRRYTPLYRGALRKSRCWIPTVTLYKDISSKATIHVKVNRDFEYLPNAMSTMAPLASIPATPNRMAIEQGISILNSLDVLMPARDNFLGAALKFAVPLISGLINKPKNQQRATKAATSALVPAALRVLGKGHDSTPADVEKMAGILKPVISHILTKMLPGLINRQMEQRGYGPSKSKKQAAAQRRTNQLLGTPQQRAINM